MTVFFKCSLIEYTLKVYVLDGRDGATVKVYVLLTLRCCNKISGGSNFKEQGLILAHSWRDQGPSWRGRHRGSRVWTDHKAERKPEAGAGSNQGLSSNPPTPFSEAPPPKFSLPRKEPPAGNQGFVGEPVSPSYSEATVEGDSCLDRHLVTMVQIRPVNTEVGLPQTV